MIFPDEHLAYVILQNTSIGNAMLRVADAINYLLLKPSEEDELARFVFASLQKGTLPESLLTADMRKEWTKTRAAVYRNSLGVLGQPTAFTAHAPSRTDGLETRDYDIVAGGHALKLHLLVADKGLEDVVVTDSARSD